MVRPPVRKTPANPMIVDPDYEQRVRERAYHLWEAEGKPHGRDVEFWERARALEAAEATAAAEAPPAPAVKSKAPRKQAAAAAGAQVATVEAPGSPADAKPGAAAKRKSRAKPE
jgi:Protein of unknown function (DUF2934)